jgi:hypothetical protein
VLAFSESDDTQIFPLSMYITMVVGVILYRVQLALHSFFAILCISCSSSAV